MDHRLHDGLIGSPNVPALGTTIRGVTSGATGEEVKEAIDDMVVIWRGSRIMGKVIMWFISLASALAAGWVAAKKLILF